MEETIFEIGQIFEEMYPPEVAIWCNESGKAYIEEITPVDGVRRFQIVGIPEPTIEESCTAALSRIDSATSAAILAGFEYEVETGEGKEVLHFSYLADDQQNFGDTFNGVAMRKLMGIQELPEAIGWNGWRNHTAEYKGDMVRLTLDADAFLALYTRGALAHKSAHMAIHGERKKAIEAAETVEEINALLEGWGV